LKTPPSQGHGFSDGKTLIVEQMEKQPKRVCKNAWLFASQGIEIEPTASPDRYNGGDRTTPKTNGVSQLVITGLEAGFFQSPTVRFWNVANSTVSFSSELSFCNEQTPRRPRSHGSASVAWAALL
jgi:hypothetical protein